jgi:uncharacterized protein (TIGR03546 family)
LPLLTREGFNVLTLLKFTRWLYKTLNSDQRPWQIALAITLGALAGMLPLGFATLCVFVVILLVNVHFGSAFFSFGIFKLIAWPLQLAVIRPAGVIALDIVPQGPIIYAAQAPVLAWLRLDYHDVAGAIAVWAIIAVPLFIFVAATWTRFREILKQKIGKSKFMKWASNKWLFKGLRYVFIGAR